MASGLSFTAYFITMLLCFLLSRHLLKSFVNRYLRHYKYYNALIRATEKDGLPLVAMIRLSPFFPPTIISYIFGTTNVQTHHYCIASFAALPSIIFFSYVGTLIEDFSSDASTYDRFSSHITHRPTEINCRNDDMYYNGSGNHRSRLILYIRRYKEAFGAQEPTATKLRLCKCCRITSVGWTIVKKIILYIILIYVVLASVAL